MVNKRVPDWLNSSLWSSTPLEDDERPSRQSTNTTTTISYSPTVEPTLDPPTPPAPPSPTRVEPEKPPETKDSPSNDSHSSDLSYNDISEEVDSSTVDISRQSQLLAEVGSFPPSPPGSISLCKMLCLCILKLTLKIDSDFCCICGNLDIEESDKHTRLAKNLITGYTRYPWDSFHGLEGM